MKEKINKIFEDDRTTRSQIWIPKEEFFLLLPTFEKVNLEEENKRKIWNKQKYWWRKPILETAEQKLFFILYYCKVYPTYDEWGLAWWIHRTMIWNWVLRYLPILQESLKRLWQIPPETGEEFNKKFCNNYEKKYIFIDWSERIVPRNVDYKKQKKFYSWKKNFIQ